MSSEASYFDVARAILESRELAFGPYSVNRVDLTAQFPGAAYLLEANGLAASQSEFLTLFTKQPRETDLNEVFDRAGKSGVTAKPIVINPEGTDDPAMALSNDRLIAWHPDIFFDRLISLPRRFPSLLRDVAGLQRANEFESTFQPREAILYRMFEREPDEQGVNLSGFLQGWLSARKRAKPILLLGERGTGKSWQLLRFALDAHTENRKAPWQNGLAFFVRLSELVNLVEEASAATPVLPQYILQKYPDVDFAFGGNELLGALLRSGHSVVCVDGFDEMDLLPTDTQVRARLTGLLLLLSKSTRFVLTCRPGHFDSLATLFSASAWGSESIAQIFEILQLVPFNLSTKVAYIRATTSEDERKALIERLVGVTEDAKRLSALQRALSTCAQHPGFLAHMVETIKDGGTPTKLIEAGIQKVFIEFNLLHARTVKSYRTVGGARVDLSTPRRMELLADIAWYMAERELPGVEPSIDLSNLPPRIKHQYKIESDVLERDLRSQTVFELIPHFESEELYPGSGRNSLSGFVDEAPGAVTASEPPRRSLARFTLRMDDNLGDAPEKGVAKVGESSVCGGYFLARHIAARLREAGPLGPLADEVRLRFLGKVKLGAQTASLLRELLEASDASYIQSLGREGWSMMRRLAIERPFSIYSPWFRHLASNLAAIGAISPAESEMLTPWTSQTCLIVRPPLRLPHYHMALVPSPRFAADGRPFLLGVHEITNDQYLRFLIASPSNIDCDETVKGSEWTVKRVTIAGNGGPHGLSRNSRLTNEYHLFFWMPPELDETSLPSEVPTYLPPDEIKDTPVTYISWFAAAAYCDWLSNGEDLTRFYSNEFKSVLLANSGPIGAKGSAGFRLPTREEWTWAARGGHDDIDRPWELFPFYLPRDLQVPSAEQDARIIDRSAWDRYKESQRIMRAILMGSGKRQTNVAYDEPNDFGVSGLMGNVREWCDDFAERTDGSKSTAGSERLILGATGFLGIATFAFDYATPLYPRNTNPDVGFRVARSLQQDELRLLQERRAEIAALPEVPKSES